MRVGGHLRRNCGPGHDETCGRVGASGVTWHVGVNRALALQLFVPNLSWLVSHGADTVSLGDKDQRNNNNIEYPRGAVTVLIKA